MTDNILGSNKKLIKNNEELIRMTYIQGICHSCGNEWSSDSWIGKCPKCNGENISQTISLKK